MQRISNYFIISAYCMLSFIYIPVSTETVTSLLIMVSFICFSLYFDNKIITAILFSCYAAAGLFFPIFYFFVPVFLCEPVRMKQYPPVLLAAFGIVVNFLPLGILQHKSIFANQTVSTLNGNTKFAWMPFFFIVLGCTISLFLDWQHRRIAFLELQYKHIRDDSAEVNFLLQDRNRLLIEKRDYEIHNALLQDRNRIAREIHDHVGHMLSRCILLTGMIKTINKDEKCSESLQLLDNELAETMNSVRSNVHNLHDEALNLEEKITELVTGFTFCTVKLHYDMKPDIPPPIKYAFLSITKEALTNVAKHSSASLVQIRIIEHPALYQLIIMDNGDNSSINQTDMTEDYVNSRQIINDKQSSLPTYSGIGLQNISERVTSLNGMLKISNKDGFSIFISIPK